MSDKIFLDTNIIVYTFDKNDTHKNIISKGILELFFTEEHYLLSTQVLLEFCNVAYRKMKPSLPEDEINNFISSFPNEKIIIINKSVIEKALNLKKQYRFSFWDSLIIGAAILSGCSKLYSEDMTDGQIVEGLKIVNPFKNEH